jgi:hypothetical protein
MTGTYFFQRAARYPQVVTHMRRILVAVSMRSDQSFAAVTSYAGECRANLIPFAIISITWIAPLLHFWVLVSGLLRSWDGAPANVGKHWPLIIGTWVASLALWRLPASWYATRDFEQRGRIYEYVGVRLFRRFVPNGDLVNHRRRREDSSFRVIGNYPTAVQYLQRTISGERFHIVLLCFGGGSAFLAWSIGWRGWATYLATANIFMNLYPILLQRYTRARISRVARRRAP